MRKGKAFETVHEAHLKKIIATNFTNFAVFFDNLQQKKFKPFLSHFY